MELTIFRVIADVVILILAFLPHILIPRLAKPARRGFFCDDQSIRYPYTENERVNKQELYAIILVPPIVLIFLIEGYRLYYDKVWRTSEDLSTASKDYKICGKKIPHIIVYIYVFVGIFLLGLAFTTGFTDLGKFTVGRLRPHFLAVCKPNWSTVDCGVNNQNYVTNYNCTGDPEQIEEARVSFPSGHSSTSCFSMIYVIIYLEVRGHHLCVRILRPFIQLLFLTLAVYTVLSRVADHWHHPVDVLAGSLLGGFIAIIVGLRIKSVVSSSARSSAKEWCLAAHRSGGSGSYGTTEFDNEAQNNTRRRIHNLSIQVSDDDHGLREVTTGKPQAQR